MKSDGNIYNEKDERVEPIFYDRSCWEILESPEKGQVWQHKDGDLYLIVCVGVLGEVLKYTLIEISSTVHPARYGDLSTLDELYHMHLSREYFTKVADSVVEAVQKGYLKS